MGHEGLLDDAGGTPSQRRERFQLGCRDVRRASHVTSMGPGRKSFDRYSIGKGHGQSTGDRLCRTP
ncbi:hypothetical protein SNL152K_949 [Streptomyces sp. NL15-2K]|nr:hypothetical protein SNL152K_949 [Streptomyces sp. NL15-2K]